MNKIVAIAILCVGCSTAANAQTFLDQLQKSASGQGKVTIHQTATISELVNGKAQKPKVTSQPSTQNHGAVADKEPSKPIQEKPKTEKPKTETATSGSSTSTSIPLEDTRKKVPSKSYKVTGYRVQVYAGGNTRADRQKAEKIGNALKSYYPSEPIYVHFYSPRWICRMGNYRSYEEAHKMLQEVKGLGYKQATIVRGKITVML